MKPLKHEVHGGYKPNAGSRPTIEATLNLKPEDIAAMKTEDVMDHCENFKSEFTQIHQSIAAFYLLHGTISDSQLDTMKTLLLVRANPETDVPQASPTLVK